MTHPADMGPDAYDAKVESIALEESVEAAITLIMRESRYVTDWFPPYSSGATDAIERWLGRLREEWRRHDREAGIGAGGGAGGPEVPA